MRKSLTLTIVFVVGLWAGAACAQRVLSMEEFRDAYRTALLKERPGAKVVAAAPDVLNVTMPDGEGVTAYLENAYVRYKADPTQLRSVLAAYVASTIASGAKSQISADRLIILVRPASYLSLQATESRFGAALNRPLAGDLIALVAVDEPTTYSFPPASKLRAALHMDDAAIWALALENTRHALPAASFKPPRRAIFAFTTGRGVASSVLADDAFWDGKAMQALGPLVVAPLLRDMVLVAQADDELAITAIRGIARQSAGDPNNLSAKLFIRQNGAWVELSP
jgi:hypothetical protein